MLLLVAACMFGCNSSDPNIAEVRTSDDVVHALPERAAQVRKARKIQALSPELYEEMSVQESRLLEHGVPGYRPLYVPGYYRAVYVEPMSRRLAWRAMTCTHPSCLAEGHEGGPFVFADVLPGLNVSADGKLVGSIVLRAVICPACNRTDAIERYCPPDVIRRRAELEAQLADIRAARDAARRNGEPMPTLTITPREIQREISDLPVLYLVEE
ncbi:MAG: hypothetical protein MI757_02895 [Pirellulales bacterium]|nr:hypothetical protein [Pirellulales bacterium]